MEKFQERISNVSGPLGLYNLRDELIEIVRQNPLTSENVSGDYTERKEALFFIERIEERIKYLERHGIFLDKIAPNQ